MLASVTALSTTPRVHAGSGSGSPAVVYRMRHGPAGMAPYSPPESQPWPFATGRAPVGSGAGDVLALASGDGWGVRWCASGVAVPAQPASSSTATRARYLMRPPALPARGAAPGPAAARTARRAAW